MTYDVKKINAISSKAFLKRSLNTHKGKNGSILSIGGSPGMSGAIILASKAALFSGAGLINVLMLDPNSCHVDVSSPEIMIRGYEQSIVDLVKKISPNVIVIGPGMELNEQNNKLLNQTLLLDLPIVIDAGGLGLLAEHNDLIKLLKTRKNITILTPHPGEAAKLIKKTTSYVQKNRISCCIELIDKTNSIIILKGHHSLVAKNNKKIYQCFEGNSGMSSAGMGDILTGTIGALIAQAKHNDLEIFDACLLGVQVHSLAADNLVAKGVGPIGLTASEVLEEIRKILN